MDCYIIVKVKAEELGFKVDSTATIGETLRDEKNFIEGA